MGRAECHQESLLCSLAEQQHLVVPLGLFSIRLTVTSRLVTSSHTTLMSQFLFPPGFRNFVIFFVVVKLKYNDIFSVPLSPLKLTMYLYPYPQIHFLWLHFFQVGYFYLQSIPVLTYSTLTVLLGILWPQISKSSAFWRYVKCHHVMTYTNDTMSV